MAAHEACAIARALIAGGKPAHTPVAIVENASMPDQKNTITTLQALSTKGFEPSSAPVLLLVGAVYGAAPKAAAGDAARAGLLSTSRHTAVA